MFPRGGGEHPLPRHSRREATRAAVPGMGNSPTGIAIAYKSGWSRGISLLEYGGLKPILPFLGGRSDAACRVVISHRAAKLRARRPPVWGIARQELQWSINQDGAWGISPLEYGGLQPILPFIEGRSDAACRVVIETIRLHVWHGIRHGDDGIWRNADRNASCRGGVFATRRFPRPPPPPSPPCAYHTTRMPHP